MAEAADGAALAAGLYWYAEKLMWGYENVEKDPDKAFRLFQQAAGLGSSDAAIRVGQLQEYGKGTGCDPRGAVRSYRAAARAGNFFAFAFLAKLLSRASHLERAEAMWTRFFTALDAGPEATSPVASRGELLFDYIATRLRLGLEPGHTGMLRRYRTEIAAHHQQLLELAVDDGRLDRLDGTFKWMVENLRD